MGRILCSMVIALTLQACSGDRDDQKSAPAPVVVPPPVAAAPREAVRETTERLFQNPYDAEAVYFLSQKNGTPEALSVLVKRVSKDGTQYSRWLFNCNDHTAQNLGAANSVQALENANNSMPSKSQSYVDASRLGAIAQSVCP